LTTINAGPKAPIALGHFEYTPHPPIFQVVFPVWQTVSTFNNAHKALCRQSMYFSGAVSRSTRHARKKAKQTAERASWQQLPPTWTHVFCASPHLGRSPTGAGHPGESGFPAGDRSGSCQKHRIFPGKTGLAAMTTPPSGGLAGMSTSPRPPRCRAGDDPHVRSWARQAAPLRAGLVGYPARAKRARQAAPLRAGLVGYPARAKRARQAAPLRTGLVGYPARAKRARQAAPLRAGLVGYPARAKRARQAAPLRAWARVRACRGAACRALFAQAVRALFSCPCLHRAGGAGDNTRRPLGGGGVPGKDVS